MKQRFDKVGATRVEEAPVDAKVVVDCPMVEEMGEFDCLVVVHGVP